MEAGWEIKTPPLGGIRLIYRSGRLKRPDHNIILLQPFDKLRVTKELLILSQIHYE